MQHTVSAFDRDIDKLRGLVGEIGVRSADAVRHAMSALADSDVDSAEKVIAADCAIDELEHKIDQLAIRTIALRAPMADDLRDLVASIKVASVIERIGDYAKNIARRVPDAVGKAHKKHIDELLQLGREAAAMVDMALDAYARRDAELARQVCERDQQVDDHYAEIFRDTLEYMGRHADRVGEATHILFIAKHLERIGDHATNVAEMVFYAATGENIPDGE